MQALFSATEEGDEELTGQVASDIEKAKRVGSVDTDEVRYDSNGDGSVSVTDKANGEVTVAENATDGSGAYDLYPAEITENLDGYLHPGMDGVTPGDQQDFDTEDAWSHLEDGVISPNLPNGGLNPYAGYEQSVEELANAGGCSECGEGDEEGRQFSVYTENYVVNQILQDQPFMERIFSEVIESEETAKVGDIKVEKLPDEDAVVVTSESTGDQARVSFDGDEMEVEELDSKEFSEDEQFEQLHVVGVDPINHVLVDAPEYDEESAQELAQDLTQQGVDGVQVFGSSEEARDYAMGLLGNLGVESEDDIESPEQAEFSDHTIYVTKYYTNNTYYMDRLFSEAANDISVSQDAIEDAIENGDEIETDDEIVTPIDKSTAIIEDKEDGDFTKATINGDSIDFDAISRSEAKDLTAHIGKSEEAVDEDADDDEEDDDEEREYSEYDYEDDYSDIITNYDETKLFSEDEILSEYMIRLFNESSDSDEEDIADAIESGEQIEVDGEIITPVDKNTAVIEDKDNGEFTKAVLDEDGDVDLKPITEDEADELTENSIVEDTDEDEDEEEEKEYSDVFTNAEESMFASTDEILTDYQVRLFNDSADSNEKDIVDAIESGEQIEVDGEVITPVDSKTAVIEDKKNGEFTKATIDEDGDLDTEAITDNEADELTDGAIVEDTDNDEDEEDDDERKFSDYTGDNLLEKFFDDVNQQVAQQAMAPQQAPMAGQAPAQTPVQDQLAGNVPVDENGNPIDPSMMQEEQPSIETIEDKAVAAVQQIQAAASEAEAAIMNAKSAPVQTQEPDIQEAQFSYYDDYEDDYEERTFSDGYDGYYNGDTLVSWLDNNTGIF
jgi:hypothetical protein